jgi:outer membrane protein assembly factor BamB
MASRSARTPASRFTHLLWIVLLLPLSAGADPHWPQFGGPSRDFQVRTTGLCAQWPTGGPPVRWKRALGDGFGQVLVEGDRLYALARNDERDVLFAMHRDTGKTIWTYEYGAPFPGECDRGFGTGPRSTPTLSDDRVFIVSAGGLLTCVDATDGRAVWSRELLREFGGNAPKWGYASSPLILDHLVILPVGGPNRAVMAFHKDDGRVVWSGGTQNNSYSSPILVRLGGRPQVIVFMQEGALGLDPRAGRVLWHQPHATSHNANAFLPVWLEPNFLFLSSGDEAGSRMIELLADGVRPVWTSQELEVCFGSVVCADGVLYGSSGTGGQSFLVAADRRTGRLHWKQRGFAKANVLYADGKLLILDEEGTLALARVGPEQYQELCSARILDRTTWTAPSLVDRTLYVRNRKDLLALDLSAP